MGRENLTLNQGQVRVQACGALLAALLLLSGLEPLTVQP
jgi:hypothetical protein